MTVILPKFAQVTKNVEFLVKNLTVVWQSDQSCLIKKKPFSWWERSICWIKCLIHIHRLFANTYAATFWTKRLDAKFVFDCLYGFDGEGFVDRSEPLLSFLFVLDPTVSTIVGLATEGLIKL